MHDADHVSGGARLLVLRGQPKRALPLFPPLYGVRTVRPVVLWAVQNTGRTCGARAGAEAKPFNGHMKI